MSKVAEYAVARHARDRNFEDVVNAMIAGGWQPLGGISYEVETVSDWSEETGRYVASVTSYPQQAMVRYEEDPPPVSSDDAPPGPQRCPQCGALDHNCPCVPF